MKHFGKYLAFILLLASACGKDEFNPDDRGTNYFPIRLGSTWIYNVSQTVYSEVNAPQQSSFKIRVVVSDSIQNSDGSYMYILTRSQQEIGSSVWKSINSWLVRKNDREIVVTEGNVAFKKLMFPVRVGLAWDGNEFNNLGEDLYRISEFEGDKIFGGTNFEDVVKIEQEFNEDFIVFLDEREEIYARNVGLVRQSVKQLNYCSTEDCIGQQKIKSGKIYVQELLSYER